MARAGIRALEFWDPMSRKWGQAHCQARYAILKVFLEAGDDFTKLCYSKYDLSDLVVQVDRNKILTQGRPVLAKFLQKLHIYKCTADVEAGSKFYEEITEVQDFWATKVRQQVLKKKLPRKIFVQANTFLDGDKVILKEYEPTVEGMIGSFAERDI